MTTHDLPERPCPIERMLITDMDKLKEWDKQEAAWKKAVKKAYNSAYYANRMQDPEFREARKAYASEYYANNPHVREAMKASARKHYANKMKDPECREAHKAARKEYDRERRAAARQEASDYMAALPRDTELELLRERWLAPGYRDFNEPMIVNELRRRGYRVDYNPPPEPDLTVRGHGPTFYVEVKAPTEKVSKSQRKHYASLAYPTVLIRTLDDIRELIDAIEPDDLAISPE